MFLDLHKNKNRNKQTL